MHDHLIYLRNHLQAERDVIKASKRKLRKHRRKALKLLKANLSLLNAKPSAIDYGVAINASSNSEELWNHTSKIAELAERIGELTASAIETEILIGAAEAESKADKKAARKQDALDEDFAEEDDDPILAFAHEVENLRNAVISSDGNAKLDRSFSQVKAIATRMIIINSLWGDYFKQWNN
jgi:hypothetical protein